MSSSVYEIVELDNGDIVLRRADDENAEPLVQIRFSEESLLYMGDAKFAVAKAMIEAGMDAASDQSADQMMDDMLENETEFVLH